MLNVGTRRMTGSVASLALLGVLLVVLLAGVPPVAAGSGSYTEDFTTATYLDAAATNVSGWGTGALRLPHKTPTLLGNYTTPSPAWGVAVAGGIAYVADRYSGLEILNVTNPYSPTFLGRYNTPGLASWVAVVGGIAYVADETAGLTIINVTDPRSPTLLRRYGTAAYALGVAVAGSVAYIAAYSAGLQIINVTDPRNPTSLSVYNTPDYAWGVAVAGPIAYVADASSGLQVINVTDPRNPTLLGTYDTPGNALGVAVMGGIAYVGDQAAGLQVFNVTNPRQPTLLGTCDTPGNALGVAIAGNIAYVGDQAAGLQVFNVTNPRQPTLLGTYDTPGEARCVVVAGPLAYVADLYSGLLVLSIADFTPPALLGTLDTWAAAGVAVVGGIAYVADEYSPGPGLYVINVTDPRAPTLLGTYDMPGMSSALGLAVVGGVAYVASGGAGLYVINVTDPRAPVLLGTLDTYTAVGVAVAGDLAYVADVQYGLRVINVTNPRAPTLLSTYITAGLAAGVAVVGGIAYVADAAGGLCVINVTDSRAPVLLGTLATTYAYHVAVVGGIAYLADYYDGLVVINVTDPRAPVLLGTLATTSAVGVAVAGDYAYVADETSGLRVVEVQRNRCRQYEPLAVAQSLTVATATSATLVRATLTCTQTLPSGTGIAYYLSPDAGSHWEAVTPGVEHVFTNVGAELRWRAVLSTTDTVQTPILTGLSVTFATRLIAPTLVSPLSGVTTGSTPTFQWTAVTGATSYLLQLDTASSFTSPNLRNVTLSGGTTSYTPTLPLTEGTWYWRVAANDSTGDLGAFSATWWLSVDATPPTWNQTPTNQVVQFSSGFRYDVNASDASGIQSYWVNDTVHFAIDSNGVITNATGLPVGVHGLEVRAYDPYANYCSATFSVTVQDTTPPTWDQVPTDQVAEFGTGFRYDVNASDASGIAYYWLNDTAHFAIDSAGVITNTVALPPGVYGVEALAYDPYANYCSGTFQVTVQDTRPPTWDQSPTNRVVELGAQFRYDVNASDASGIAYYWINDTTHFAIDSNGIITNVTALSVGIYGLEVRAYDPYSNFCSATFTLTVQDTLPPTWDQTPTDQVLEYGSDFRYDVNASDPSGVAYYWVSSSAFIVDGAGVITSVNPLYIGEYWLEVRAYDPYDHYCYAEFKIIVQDTLPPTWDQLPTNLLVEFGSNFVYHVNASDASGIDHCWVNDTSHFGISPDGAITNTGVLSVGVHALEVRAYDAYSHYCSATFTVTVRDTTPPQWFPAPVGLTVPYGQPVAYQLSATDLSGIDHYAVSDTVHFAISITGLLTNVSTLASGSYELTVTAYDPYDNGISATFAITVLPQPTTPPPIPGFPWPAILLASVAAVSLSLYRRRPRR